MMRKFTISLLAIILSIGLLSAQNESSENPKWVDMMQDKNANFYVLTAFSTCYAIFCVCIHIPLSPFAHFIMNRLM